MVQVVENGTDIDCTIKRCRPSSTLPDYDQLTIAVDTATPVPGLADLISRKVGQDIDLMVQRKLLPDDSLEGWHLRCRASMAGPGNYRAEKDPPSERFLLTPRGGI